MAENEQATDAQEKRNVAINAQYVKDLSFENPRSAKEFEALKDRPQMNVSVDVQVNPIKDKEQYEVVLQFNVEAKVEDKVLFIAELSYAGIFSLTVPENEIPPILMVYCPSILFPYARRVLSDVTRDGGFPPVMLDPIDFLAMYQRHQQQQAGKAEANQPEAKKPAAPKKKEGEV